MMAESMSMSLSLSQNALQQRKEMLYDELRIIRESINPKSKISKATTTLNELSEIKSCLRTLQQEVCIHNAKCKANKDNSDLQFLVDIENFKNHADIIRVTAEICVAIESSRASTSKNNDDNDEPISRTRLTKLPEISLPRFSGAVSDFLRYKAIFDSLVHNDKTISTISKFQYLISSLSGEPLALVSAYEINEENYKNAYDALVARYANKRRAAAFYIHQLLGYDKSNKNLTTFLETHRNIKSGLAALKIDDLNDFIQFELAYSNLDRKYQELFDRSLTDKDELPSLEKLMTFVESCAISKELQLDVQNISGKSAATGFVKSKFNFTPQKAMVTNNVPKQPCFFCKNNHLIYVCSDFKKLPVQERYDTVKRLNRCTNCLGDHPNSKCPSVKTCFACRKKHNTLLHFDAPRNANENDANAAPATAPNNSPTPNPVPAPATDAPSTPRRILTCLANSEKRTVLATIKCKVLKNGTYYHARAILDPCSEINLITKGLADFLELPIQPDNNNMVIQGVSESQTQSTGVVNIKIFATATKFSYSFNASVLDTICGNVPTSDINLNLQDLLKYKLADPDFTVSQPIQILLGATEFAKIMNYSKNNVFLPSSDDSISALDTKFGIVLIGEVNEPKPAITYVKSMLVLRTDPELSEKLEKTVEKFWEIESVPNDEEETKLLSPENQYCENLFVETTTRAEDGKYVVRLPIIPGTDPDILNNRFPAKKQASLLRDRLSGPKKEDFEKFMTEYITSGHMTRSESESNFILPYHVIQKLDSSTTKTRVVFNASAKAAPNKQSINDCIYQGPDLQANLANLLINFRSHKIIVTTDVKQMFRNIYLNPVDRKYQHIFYAPPREELSEFELNTVTYGFNSSPWLAQRVMRKHADDYSHSHPNASLIVKKSGYMDDYHFGGDNLNDVIQLRDELIDLMDKGGFALRKWSASDQGVLESIPTEHQETGTVHKVLGAYWDTAKDTLTYKIQPFTGTYTKRNILSYIAKLFDPNGIIAPIILKCKYFMQKLWCLKIDWDQTLPDFIELEWTQIVTDLTEISEFQIPRFIGMKKAAHCETYLVGFCDASQKGYAAVIYLVTHNSLTNTYCSALLRAKTRVAPLKQISIPRLELLGAHLLAQTVQSVLPILETTKIFLFCDSEVVLAWLKKDPSTLLPFNANRVLAITRMVPDAQWFYVSTHENPCDIASRGCSPRQLINNQLWLEGPKFLKTKYEFWSNVSEPNPVQKLPDVKRVKKTLLVIQENLFLNYFKTFSKLSDLERKMGWIRRFIYNSIEKVHKRTGPLSSRELNEAQLECIRVVQHNEFTDEFSNIEHEELTSVRLRKLSPFIDERGILRVGGRISKSDLPYSCKHPILLPKKCHLSQLICLSYHTALMHAGPRTTLSFIQRKYWILGAHSLVRKWVHSCIVCHRFASKPTAPIMAQLPVSRLETVRAFNKIGLDFAGYFNLKDTGLRKAREYKAYVMVIVCHSTKAVYLDLVSELTTAAFLAAFSRFTSRRGLPSEIFCDRGTNFCGAANAQKEIIAFLRTNNKEIFTNLSTQNVKWNFNVPLAPHMAGLQESGVKSFKRLLYKQMKNEKYTWEVFYTILTKIEAVLNSRPIGALSNDPQDVDVLTPGHFLIGAPLCAPPEEIEETLPTSYLKQWNIVRQNHQQMWDRWRKEYVSTLIEQKKWFKPGHNLHVGQLVYMADLPSHPLSWPLGRVVEVYPGSDGVVRSALVKTNSGSYHRPLVKLVVLPNVTFTD